jgi:hypothetical protein
MAVAGIRIALNLEGSTELVENLGKFLTPRLATPIVAAAIRKAIVPTRRRLQSITPVGPTGNLKASVGSKVVSYPQDGVAVGIVGFARAGRAQSQSAAGGSVRAGKDRAFHQWWLENGTVEREITKPVRRKYSRKSPTVPFVRRRRTASGVVVTETVQGKGVVHEVQENTPTYIASSFRRLGPFRVLKAVGGDGRVQTDPAYPRAFFRKSNTPIIIPAMPAGGTSGQPPLETAWLQTQGEVADILQRELSLSLAEAWAALRFRDSGTLSGTDTL